MNDEHHTEADGLEVTWRLTHDERRQIEIMKVCNISGDADSDVMFAPGTDLVVARESRPGWDRLWDKVQREFWASLLPAPRSSGGNRGAVR